MAAIARHLLASIRTWASRAGGDPRRRLLLAMASVLLLSGCVLSPVLQATAALTAAIAVLLGLTACSGGSGGGGAGAGGGGDAPGGGGESVPPAVSDSPLTVPGCMSNLSVASASVTWPAAVNIAAVVADQGLGVALAGAGPTDAGLGNALAAGCDVNGDGHFDLVIGQSQYNSGLGRVWVVFGNPTIAGTLATVSGNSHGFPLSALTASDGFAIAGMTDSGLAGTAVAMGDINGDAVADVVIGQPGYGSNDGAAWAIFGGSTLSTVHSLQLSSVGDGLTPDGSKGFLILTTETHSYANSNNSNVVATVTGGNHLGTSVAVVELGGDALGDVVVGGPSNATHYSYSYYSSDRTDRAHVANRPRAALVFGTSSAMSGGAYDISGRTYLGRAYYAGPGAPAIGYSTSLGASVAVAGDLNGDGILDMIAGAPYTSVYIDSATSGTFGAAHVLFGKSGNPASATPEDLTGQGFSLMGGSDNRRVGDLVAPAGDVNGDGIPDVMVSSRRQGEGFFPQVHGVFGKPAGSSWSSQRFASQLSTTGEGFTVRLPYNLQVSALAAADMNGDGISDLLIGTPNASVDDDGSNPPQTYGTGAVFVVFGKSGITDIDLTVTPLDGVNGFHIVGEYRSHIGKAIAVGDVNGDGIADLIVSGQTYTVSTSSAYGAVFVVFGGPAASLPEVTGVSGTLVVARRNLP